MHSIPNEFKDTELLLRAIYPPEIRPGFWTGKRITSAALKDSNGLSVTRTYDRTTEIAVGWMRKNYQGAIISISIHACNAVKAYPVYLPTRNNKYHSEIHGSPSEIELSDEQALILSREAVVEYPTTLNFVS